MPAGWARLAFPSLSRNFQARGEYDIEGKGSDAPLQNPASSSQSGICAAVSAQSGTIIGAGAALDCKGGVPLLCAPALQFQSGTRIPVMPLWGARAEYGEGNCRSYCYSTSTL